MSRQDSSFYTNQAGAETVWEEQGNPYFVVRNGEMRINYRPDPDNEQVIRYTDRLEAIGVKDDSDLQRFTELGEEVFCWVNNSWFEVWHNTDTDYYSEPLHELNEAIEYAKELNNAQLVR